jgi:hypothetical protein
MIFKAQKAIGFENENHWLVARKVSNNLEQNLLRQQVPTSVSLELINNKKIHNPMKKKKTKKGKKRTYRNSYNIFCKTNSLELKLSSTAVFHLSFLLMQISIICEIKYPIFIMEK